MPGGCDGGMTQLRRASAVAKRARPITETKDAFIAAETMASLTEQTF